MGDHKHGSETTHEERVQHRMQVVYAQKTQQRQVFMEGLKEYRKRNDKRVMKIMIDSIGPKWYQALSVPQRTALDTLESCIYQDLLEGRPIRTVGIMKSLGIYPRPHATDLMNCVYMGRDDPKEMLARLFLLRYGHTIDGRRTTYDLNGRLLLSSILYLGLENLISMLRERFRPDQEEKEIKPKPKRKPGPPLASPYLQKMVAALYEPARRIRKPPPPLPNLDDLNEPFEEDPPLPKPPPPPPPPPPPKKRLPREYCDKLAGVVRIEPHISELSLTRKPLLPTSQRTTKRLRGLKKENKKVYGIGITRHISALRRRKPKVPSTGLYNSQYTIVGVSTVHGKPVFVLGNISILPSAGELIHGGYTKLPNGEFINIHCGFRAYAPPPKPESCDCVKKWTNTVLQYVKESKCNCGHRYDYGNEGQFLPEDLPFFQKPTRHGPMQFNYNNIYDVDPKRLHVAKEFKRVWDTESMLRVEDETQKDAKKPMKKKRSSVTCLGQKPAPEDYLRCALRHMRRVNIASRLPDIHLVPELREWMRRRIYGPFTRLQKAQLITKSNKYWQRFTTLAKHGVPHFAVPKEVEFSAPTTWTYKQSLNDKFQKFIQKYRIDMFRMHADFSNLMWPSMYQAQFPDKKFREIFFSYVFGTVEDLQIMHPYSSRESAERCTVMLKRRYYCPPAGIEYVNE